MELDSVQLGGVIGITYLLVKLIEKMFDKVMERRANNKNINLSTALTQQQSHQLQSLHDMHSRYDDDGVPMWFVPRSWGETQKEVAKSLEKVVNINEQQTKILDKIIEKIM